MTARAGLNLIAQEKGWTVADNGRFASYVKGDRFISIKWSVRGAVTTARVADGGRGRSAVGAGKFKWVRSELMRNV